MSASITWLGHATIRLTLADGRVILIDPWLKDDPSCPEKEHAVPRCDMILLTHGHFDHIADVERIVKEHKPTVVATFELCAILEKRTGTGTFSGMNTGGTQEVDGVRVSLTTAFHSSSVDGPDGPIYAGMPNGLIVDVDGHAKVYHAGDTEVFSDMKIIAALHAPKICILPIGDHFTMGARGAALAAEYLQPTAILPVHYRTFPLLAQSADAFRDALAPGLQETLVVPEVGEAVAWTAGGLG